MKRGKYTGEALKTYEAIHSGNSYSPRQIYINNNGIYYYINAWGYMHIYTARKEKDEDGQKYYCIVDNLLTEENTLQESCVRYYTDRKAARAEIEKMKENAIFTEAPEAPTAPETVTDGETTTEAEKAPQNGTQRPTDPTGATPEESATGADGGQADSQTTPTERQTAPQTAETGTDGETPTAAPKAPPRATQRPKTGRAGQTTGGKSSHRESDHRRQIRQAARTADRKTGSRSRADLPTGDHQTEQEQTRRHLPTAWSDSPPDSPTAARSDHRRQTVPQAAQVATTGNTGGKHTDGSRHTAATHPTGGKATGGRSHRRQAIQTDPKSDHRRQF